MHIIHINLAKGFRGGERQTQLLIQELAQNSVTQTLICREDSPLNTLKDLSVSIIHQKHYLQGLNKRLTVHAPSLIHAHDTKAAYYALLQNLRYKIPYLITRRVDHPLKNSLKHRLLYSRASTCVALSSVIKNELARFNPHLEVIPSAYIPQQTTAPSNDLRNLAKNRWIVGHIGALEDKHKGQRLLFDLAPKHPEWFFVFLGDGADKDAFLQETQHLENIYFAGFQKNILPYLEQFDVFAFPSRYEGLGSSLLDAMAQEKTIVASHVGGIPDIIKNERNGLLFAPNDSSALEAALMRVYEDPHLAQSLAQRAKEDSTQFSAEKMAQRYLSLYRSVL